MRQAVSLETRSALLGWSVLAIVTFTLIGMGEREADAQTTGGTQSEERGALLYSQHCARCHGASGNGGPMEQYEGRAPALRPEVNPAVTAAYLDLVMATGRMPPAASPYDNRTRNVVFDDQDRADIIAWMRAEFDVEGDLPAAGEGNAARGQAVWNANCGHCHGAAGAGGVAGAGAWTPSVSDQSAEVIAEAIRVGPFQMPQFGDTQISDEEINDVVAFMDEVAEEPRTPILGLVELNPVYASAYVAGLALLVLLSLAWIGGRPAWFPDPEQPQTPDVPAGARPRDTQPEEAS